MTKINDRFFSSFYNTSQHCKQLIICNNKEVKSFGVAQNDEEADILYKEAQLWLSAHGRSAGSRL